jgi:hypothetical protein
MNNLNKVFWEDYYKTNTHDINKNSSFAQFVYEKYINEFNSNGIFLNICDLGAGNCRDSIYFSMKGNKCNAIDINGVLDKEYNNCQLIKEDVENTLQSFQFQETDIMYMRWFLHAFPYEQSSNIFNLAVKNLKQNGLICIEVRSLNDEDLKRKSVYSDNDKSFETTHKRWLYTVDMCKSMVSHNNCHMLYCEEGFFSKNMNTETTNPLLIRFICQKM